MTQDLVIWGASGHATVVADAVRSRGDYQVVGFLDDLDPSRRELGGAPVLGGREQLPKLLADGVHWLFVAVGDCVSRLRLARIAAESGFQFATIVHPATTVAADSEIGEGCFLAAGSVLGPSSTVHPHAILNTQSGVDHHCVVGGGAHLAPGARIAGGVAVGRGTLLGIGSCVVDHTTIGEFSIVGAGGVVVSDLPDRCVAMGVPARVVRKRSESEVEP